MALYKRVDGKRVKMTLEEEAKLRAEWDAHLVEEAAEAYKKQRASEYPKIGDQLDCIYKGLKALAEGKPLCKECLDWITKIDEIKAKYPKPIGD